MDFKYWNPIIAYSAGLASIQKQCHMTFVVHGRCLLCLSPTLIFLDYPQDWILASKLLIATWWRGGGGVICRHLYPLTEFTWREVRSSSNLGAFAKLQKKLSSLIRICEGVKAHPNAELLWWRGWTAALKIHSYLRGIYYPQLQHCISPQFS